jgi:UDP-glucose:(heptosyl)LPS alpha-1,3-glucosyltransferase
MQPAFTGLLAIAGNDPPARWEGLVSQLGLKGRVIFRGREPVIEQLYAAADLVVLASLFEGYGNVIPEAMACGCPVLTAKSVGAADFVEHGKTGWVLEDCNDIPAYTHCLEQALTSADLAAMGQAAAAAIQPYTWEWTVDRLEEVYRRIAEEKGRQWQHD